MTHGQKNIKEIILKGIRDKLDVIMWTGANGSGQEAVNLTSWAFLKDCPTCSTGTRTFPVTFKINPNN